MEGLENRQTEMEDRLREVRNQVAELRRAMRSIEEEKRSIINTIKIKNSDAERFKKARDRLNAKVKERKKDRAEINRTIKDLFVEYNKAKEKSPKNDFRRLEREIDQLEWRLQTTVLKIEKEDELVKRIKDLKEEMKDYKEISEISRKIDKAKARSDKVHKKILKLSEKSQQQHERFLEAVNRIRELEGEIDVLNKKRAGIVPKLNELTEIMTNLTQSLKKTEKKMKKIRSRAGAKKEDKELEMKRRAKSAFERFQNGEKLGTEDIYLLQRFNLV